MNDENKIIIYQVFTRLFGNNNNHCVYNGDIVTNGCGKMADFTLKALSEIKKLGTTHIWYTGIIEHATQTDYRRYNISPDHPAIVKGKAGSPYAIKDYYDVDPDLANDVQGRMKEFENLVHRTHRTGLKVIIDFVPNHVARQYHSDAQPDGTTELGANDDPSQSFSPYNNFYYIPQAELRAQFDMKDGAAEPYREFPAKATACDLNGKSLVKKAIKNLVDWQKDDGVLYSPVPAGSWNKELPVQMLASVGKYGIWNYYVYTGDSATIKEAYPAVRKYLSLWELDERNLVKHRTGGWDWSDWGQDIDVCVLDNAWYSLALEGLANMATLLGDQLTAEDCLFKMRKVREAVNKYYWNGRLYRNG